MPRDGFGVYSKASGTTAVSGATVESAKYNAAMDDLVDDLNAARPVVAGGTGATNAADALDNLGVNSMLIGQVGWFAMTTAPTGWLKANGAAISRTTYADLFSAIGTTFGAGDGSTTFNLPDLRGEFVRGYDDGRGVDAARAFGSSQSHALQDHYHKSLRTLDGTPLSSGGTNYDIFAEGGATDETAVTGYIHDSAQIAAETRPRNVALLACIKY